MGELLFCKSGLIWTPYSRHHLEVSLILQVIKAGVGGLETRGFVIGYEMAKERGYSVKV